jgi:HSP20 family protein
MRRNVRHPIQPLFISASEAYQESCWCPAADVYRCSSGWLIKFDVAGVRPADIELRVEGRRLIVRGVRHDYAVTEGQQAYTMEIAYNRFERALELPCDLEGMVIRQEYRDGMLLVTITPETDS